MRLRHRGDVEHLLQAADGADVGVEDICRALLEDTGEILLGVEGFAGHDGRRDRATDFGDEVEIVGEAGLFVAEDAVFLEPLGDADGMMRRDAAVRVDQQVHVGAERLAHRLDVGDGVILFLAGDEGAPRPGERVPF